MVEAVALLIKSVRRAGVTVCHTFHASHFHVDVGVKLEVGLVEVTDLVLLHHAVLIVVVKLPHGARQL